MRKLETFLLVSAALVLVGAGCTTSTTTTTNPYPPAQPSATAPAPTSMKGRAVFSVTDAAADMNGVTSVMVTIDKVEVHSATQGWVSLSSSPKTYDLLVLKSTDSAKLLADADIAAGTYDQVRLDISKATVTADGKVQEAKLPSGSLKMVGKLTVTAGQTSTAEFDVIADKSLHVTGNGKFILAPVVRLTTKTRATVKIDASDKVEVTQGDKESDETDGMDVNGEVKANFELKDKLDIDASGTVVVHVDGQPAHCGGNMMHPLACGAGYHCAPVPGSKLPFGDVGGLCVRD